MAIDYMALHAIAMERPNIRERPHVELHRLCKQLTWRWKNDGYAEEYLVAIIRSAIGLLSMESGRLDCGTLDHSYRDMLEAITGKRGFEP